MKLRPKGPSKSARWFQIIPMVPATADENTVTVKSHSLKIYMAGFEIAPNEENGR